jgi:hypothetical protein
MSPPGPADGSIPDFITILSRTQGTSQNRRSLLDLPFPGQAVALAKRQAEGGRRSSGGGGEGRYRESEWE